MKCTLPKNFWNKETDKLVFTVIYDGIKEEQYILHVNILHAITVIIIMTLHNNRPNGINHILIFK
jgi:hypothetical protein